MTTKLVNSASIDGQIIKSGLADGRRAIYLPSVAEFAHDWLRIDGYLGNVGSYKIPRSLFAREVVVNCGRSMLRRFQMDGQTLEGEQVMDRLLLTH